MSLAFDPRGFEFFEGAPQYAQEGHLAGGLKNNREYVGECAQFDAIVPEEIRALLAFVESHWKSKEVLGARAEMLRNSR